MQSVRANITRIKNGIEEKFPDDPDIFGYQGIDKSGLMDMLTQTHSESYRLVELEPDIELTVLKRKLVDKIEFCREFVHDFKDNSKTRKAFNDFLINLTSIRDEIRLSYVFLTEGGLRNEEYLLEITELARKAEEQYSKNKEFLDGLSDKVSTIKNSYSFLEKVNDDADEILKNIRSSMELINGLQTKASASFEVVTKYEKQITESHSSVNESSAEIERLEAQANKANENLKASRKATEDLIQRLDKQISENEKQQTEIRKTLSAANRVGMAGSFHSRKKELGGSLFLWGICFVITVIGIFYVGFWLVNPFIGDVEKIMSIGDFLLKLIVVAPLVWLAWMSARQFGYLSRIREDYSFKYATAMAFEGYKKHADEIDENLLVKLLDHALETMSQNPIRLYSGKDNHASPLQELAEKMSVSRGSVEDGQDS